MKTTLIGPVLLWLLMNTSMLFAQEAPDVFKGYEGEGRIHAIYILTNPEKLAHLPRLSASPN